MSSEVILITGPTASGKSALAIKLALEYGGVIINADSMQVYRQLHVITARPDISDLRKCPHRLYGYRDAGKSYSAFTWLDDARNILQEAMNQNKVAIFVGGTGLYFKSLIEGLSSIPPIDPVIRLKWRNFAKSSAEKLYNELKLRDPVAAERTRTGDHQRLIRALEVIDSTGKSIFEWHNENRKEVSVPEKNTRKILLMPEKSALHTRINSRFDKILENGAIEEVERLLELKIDPSLPAMKAIGVQQLTDFISGKITLKTAIEKSKAASRQYAKRQFTWFNNQLSNSWEIFNE